MGPQIPVPMSLARFVVALTDVPAAFPLRAIRATL